MSDCCLTPNEEFVSCIMVRTICIRWDDNDIHFVLHQHTSLDLFVPIHRNNSPRLDLTLHSDTLSWIRPSSLCPCCCVFSGEATHTNFIVFGLTQSGLEPTIYDTWDKHANYRVLHNRCATKGEIRNLSIFTHTLKYQTNIIAI